MFAAITNTSGAKTALTTSTYFSYKKMADLKNMVCLLSCRRPGAVLALPTRI